MGPWYWGVWELPAFECAKTSVDKERKFRKNEIYSTCVSNLTIGKIILLHHFNYFSFTLWMPTLLWMPGAVAQFAPSPLCTSLGTVDCFQKAWFTYGQVRLCWPYTKLEKQTKRIMTTQPFFNNLLFTIELFRWNKSTHCSVHLHCLFFILECST